MAPQLAAILIHGLPEPPPTAPFDRLGRVAAQVEDLVPNVRRFAWGEILPMAPLHLRRGTFASELVPKFQNYLNDASTVPRDADLVIIGYSAGGFIFYRWLLDPAVPEQDKSRIALAIMLAAPYHCRRGEVLLEYVDRALRVAERTLDPEEIEAIAGLLGPRLKVVLAEDDMTVTEPDASFSEALQVQYGVKQVLVPGATHLSLCDEASVCDIVHDSIAALGRST